MTGVGLGIAPRQGKSLPGRGKNRAEKSSPAKAYFRRVKWNSPMYTPIQPTWTMGTRSPSRLAT